MSSSATTAIAAPPIVSDSDETLLARYREEGDEAAFAALYQRHRSGLYRFIHGLCPNTAQTDEIFQETWLALIKSETSPDGRARFKTWLYQIARHRLIDHWRRGENAAMKNEVFDETEHTPHGENDAHAPETPETLALRAEQLRHIAAALDTLPLPQREVFLLRAHAGMELSEIAALTETSLEAIKSRYRYAVDKLRRQLFLAEMEASP